MLIEELAPYDCPSEQYRLEQEGAELIRLKLAQLQRVRLRVRQLASVPRSMRTEMIAEEMSLAMFNLCQVRFAISVLASRLRWLRLQRQGQQVASALRLAAPTASERAMPATHIAGAQT